MHQALGAGTPTSKAIATQFGRVFLNPDGSVDRALVGKRVFSDAESRRVLEAIVHPTVYQAVGHWYSTLDHPYGVASIPLLFETGRERDFDVVAVTFCPREQQVRRIMERDRLSQEDAEKRIAAQMPAEDKARRGDFVIQTSGSKQETDRQIEGLLVELGKKLQS